MLKRITALGLLLILAVTLIGCGTAVSYSWVATTVSSNAKVDSWTISAKSIDGHASRNIDMTSEKLAALHAENTSSDGGVFLVMTQGDTEKTFDLSGEFNGSIDTSAFEPGRVKLRLNFEKAKDVKVYINW